MSNQISNKLYDQKDSRDFYDERYTKGYMEEWPNDKKQRIYEIITNLNLPGNGTALDFGCGNGVFTDILKKALPNWDVCGCDISEIAIKHASERFPNCRFFVNDDEKYRNKKFDFIFSHHVLEHVFNLKEAVSQINARADNSSSMLHILPCGNEGSLEHKICDLRLDGINKEMENRFFFEDEGHVRRLTTETCAKIFSGFGFALNKEYYCLHHYGTIEWITKHPRYLFLIFNPRKGKDIKSKIKLILLFLKFGMISSLRIFSIIPEKLKNGKKIYGIIFFVPIKISEYIDNYIINLSNKEWQKRKNQRNGSEMYLYFTKNT